MHSNTKGCNRIVLWLLLIKLAYLGGVYLAVGFWPDMDEENYHQVMRHWPMEGEPEFASHFGTWDAAHYLYLSTMGYAAGVNSCAFYPLWPLTIRWFSVFTGGSHLIAGMVLANLFSLAGWTLFYQLTARRFGETVALWALVFLILFPGSLFYQFVYSEPLFFLLTMLLWRGLERKQFYLAWLGASLLPLSRPTGVFAILPIGWHWLMKRRWSWLDRLRWLEAERQRVRTHETSREESRDEVPLTRPSDTVSHAGGEAKGEGARFVCRAGPDLNAVRVRWRDIALLAAPWLGWGVYFTLIWSWTGNPLEGIKAQKHWGAHSISNLWNLPKFVVGFFEPTAWHDFRGSVLDRCGFILLLYTLPLIWRLGKDMVVWTYVLAILPAMSGTFTSFIRYESTAFPLFIGLAVFFTSLKPRWPLWGFVILNAVLHAILLWRFVNFRWAG